MHGFLAGKRQGAPPPPQNICATVTQFPFQALQQMLQCFGYTHTVKMQSGRTVVVGSEIAQGGFSFVYNARDAKTGEQYALKKILCQTDEQTQLAKNEIQAHKLFSHPHIMPLEDYAVVSLDTSVQAYYLLFPFMPNGTLREMIDVSLARRLPIPETQILEMFLKVCRAVAELHSRSPPLAHRDIKPENILLSREDEPILTDFGSLTNADVIITKRSDALMLQERAAQMCSMPYRAPVWSLGCLLYAMAFGYSPSECAFTDGGGVRVTECSYLAVIGPIKFPKAHPFSKSFCDFICWILTQDPNARPTVPANDAVYSTTSSTPARRTLLLMSQHSHSDSDKKMESEGSTRCDACKSCGAVVELAGCGHRFHPRCIFQWPIEQCELCHTDVQCVRIFRTYNNTPNLMVRKGKWSADEHKYANMMMKQFQLGALPLVDGLHLRGFISSLLQCDPLRVTKKYAGHAIGKQNFYFQSRKNYCYNLHIKLQKRVSALRNHFYWHIQYRCKFGYSINIQELKAAEADFWIREFLKFANQIGQKVEMARPTPPSSPVAAASIPSVALPESVELPVIVPELVADAEQPATIEESTAPVAIKTETQNKGPVESPLSFEEWNDPAPSFLPDFLDTMAWDDFSQPDCNSSQPSSGSLSTTSTTSTIEDALLQSAMGEFFLDGDASWKEAMAATSWTFSLTDSQEPPIYC
ncbi:TPA: hypothetical protein N0F65_006062 [Lagenidium giganteum]|uniref:Protein kinase domain-containing protein n=1 Tax=Lagenidium giganteum TaxID=4803 RepID=A0AAV2YP54_9STRA|nr:TPA: hypothetical protein N0F65_006062 [Lagenidium giganteum]